MIQITAAVIIKNGKIFITKDKAGICITDKWGFPGGKIEADETMVQSLQRQLAQSMGIQVTVDNFICASHYNDNYGDIELFAYEVSLLSEQPLTQSDSNTKWVSPTDLPLLDFAEAYLPVCQRIADTSHT
jgi:8-oxo-dGTP diphosphatase